MVSNVVTRWITRESITIHEYVSMDFFSVNVISFREQKLAGTRDLDFGVTESQRWMLTVSEEHSTLGRKPQVQPYTVRITMDPRVRREASWQVQRA